MNVASWHHWVMLVFTLCQWKVRGAKVGLCLRHKLALIRLCVCHTSNHNPIMSSFMTCHRIY
jgi:hypothetical protein